MPRYAVTGRNAAGTNNNRQGALWNPSSAKPLWVESFLYATQDTNKTMSYTLRRITTRGTPGSTVTPDIDNDYDKALAPPSGAVLDLAIYTVNPTEETAPYMEQVKGADTTTAGCGFILEFDPPLKIPPGTGLLVRNAGDPTSVGDMTFVWTE